MFHNGLQKTFAAYYESDYQETEEVSSMWFLNSSHLLFRETRIDHYTIYTPNIFGHRKKYHEGKNGSKK